MNYGLDRNLTKRSVKLDDGVFEYTREVAKTTQTSTRNVKTTF